ncbi:hypothetical protein OX284_001080 [Flavobacterium sp. SUN046]|uniref:hypothetical protein n=1 Tax=Flavobacterium sp. SUN046 TaxID=3002440 RepID=UPI002DBFF35A|nr:hypothetical protein [Flavobacterium sp. SUN046]MEC4048006.1 hypothetical protein [Flavobacterium sp. SUN046]
MRKFSLNLGEKPLLRNEMKLISAAKAEGQNYAKYYCKTGGGSGSASNVTMSEIHSIATSNCGAGNYSIICVGDC